MPPPHQNGNENIVGRRRKRDNKLSSCQIPHKPFLSLSLSLTYTNKAFLYYKYIFSYLSVSVSFIHTYTLSLSISLFSFKHINSISLFLSHTHLPSTVQASKANVWKDCSATAERNKDKSKEASQA